jgi:general nucleoside transport system permease protein
VSERGSGGVNVERPGPAVLLRRGAFAGLPFVVALAFAGLLILLVGQDPLEAFRLILEGSLGSPSKLSDTVMVWVPLTLAAAGLVVTFTAGLWNIGVEGQIVLGAIGASLIAREVAAPPAVLVPLTLVMGVVFGIGWALLAGILKTHGKVNEIFGGLGLDFVATGLTLYLIIGPWARPGIASTSGTEPFPAEAWLPALGDTRFSPLAVVLAILGVIAVWLMLRGTRFGLKLRAVGRNSQSAHLLGIPTTRYILVAFALCGALAGLAGAIQATGFHHKLVPTVSGGYGFLGILVVLLAAFRAVRVAPIAAFFAIVMVGSVGLTLRLGMDSAIGGVLTGVLVLFSLIGAGLRAWSARRRAASVVRPPDPRTDATAAEHVS